MEEVDNILGKNSLKGLVQVVFRKSKYNDELICILLNEETSSPEFTWVIKQDGTFDLWPVRLIIRDYTAVKRQLVAKFENMVKEKLGKPIVVMHKFRTRLKNTGTQMSI